MKQENIPFLNRLELTNRSSYIKSNYALSVVVLLVDQSAVLLHLVQEVSPVCFADALFEEHLVAETVEFHASVVGLGY